MDGVASCLKNVDLTASDTSIDSPTFVAVKKCFAEKGHIFVEEVCRCCFTHESHCRPQPFTSSHGLPTSGGNNTQVSKIEDDFLAEMKALEKCSSTNAAGIKILDVGTRRYVVYLHCR